jgi:hypothetical protein
MVDPNTGQVARTGDPVPAASAYRVRVPLIRRGGLA